MKISVFVIVGKGRNSAMQRLLCQLFKYASDGVEGLGWTVSVLGSNARRYHQEGFQLLNNTLRFVDYQGKPCALVFQFTGSPDSNDLAATYRIYRSSSDSEETLEEDGVVLFGAEALFRASKGDLFGYIQTPD